MSLPSSSSRARDDGQFRARLDRLRDRVDLVALVGKVVPLGRGAKPRGKCPFHGSKSDSFAIDPERGSIRCWGCQWSGDALKFVTDYYGLTFGDALRQLEANNGLNGLDAAPIRRAKRPAARSSVEMVSSLALGRHLWRVGVSDVAALRVYLAARRVPEAMLDPARFADFRFVGLGPIVPWRVDAQPDSVPQAPAMVALVRKPPDWGAIGVHVTFLRPDLAGKMARKRRDGEMYPARKMLGAVGGGAVLLGPYDDTAPLYVGEGIETVLSGMALAGADARAVGLAALSLDNLQGGWPPRLIRDAIPLFDPRPDPARAAALAFPHRGVVTGLVDADMAPLRGVIDRQSGRARGVTVIERKGGPIVRRAISGGERADICGAMFVHAWRGQGCRASAVRPRMGLDFNDVTGGGAG